MNKEQHRTLQLETLENREMLSINPLVPLDADISFNAPVIQAAVPQDANAADVAAMNALINKTGNGATLTAGTITGNLY